MATALAVVAGVTALVVGGSTEQAQATGLARFESCRELAAWGDESAAELGMSRDDQDLLAFEEVGEAVSGDSGGGAGRDASAAAPTAVGNEADPLSGAAEGDGGGGTGGTGGTNVIVEGVDELDLVDRISGDLVLVTAGNRLAIADLDAGSLVATIDVPADASVTYDTERGIAWVAGYGHDDGRESVVLERIEVTDGALVSQGSWSVEGRLVAARRIGDRLHLVASDGFDVWGDGGLPFAGDPVPCDEVLHPIGPSDPSATLLATFTAGGPVEPTRTAQVVGSGQLVHLTHDAVYLATPGWDDGGGVDTGLHRFDLHSLAHTGSGSVAGTLLNEFSMSEHDGRLRVAVTHGGGGFGGPIGMPFVDVDDAGAADGGAEPGVAVAEGDTGEETGGGTDENEPPPVGEEEPEVGADPVPTSTPTTFPVDEPEVQSAPRAERTPTQEQSPSPSVTEPAPPVGPDEPVTSPDPADPTPLPVDPSPDDPVTDPGDAPPVEPEPTEPLPTEPMPIDPMPVEPAPEGSVLNEVVVLDTDGDLDVIGRTDRFGKPGETIHGIRFAGDVAYAVTFLTTDPFYVIDLSDPSAPVVVGEVELPGFSAYLHPIDDRYVVGFGPGERGTAAKLFDVSDPTSPQVVDSLDLGNESPVAWDHHAFTSLGDTRFAVPAWDYREGYAPGCTPERQAQDREAMTDLEAEMDEAYSQPDVDEAVFRDLELRWGQLRCAYPQGYTLSSVVTVEVSGGRLVEVERQTADTASGAERVIPGSNGWTFLADLELVLLDAAGDVRTTLSLG